MLEIELTLFEEYFQKSENKKVCNKITDFEIVVPTGLEPVTR